MKLTSNYVDNLQITLRLPRELWERVQELAEENGISSGQKVIVQIVERALNDLQSDIQQKGR